MCFSGSSAFSSSIPFAVLVFSCWTVIEVHPLNMQPKLDFFYLQDALKSMAAGVPHWAVLCSRAVQAHCELGSQGVYSTSLSLSAVSYWHILLKHLHCLLHLSIFHFVVHKAFSFRLSCDSISTLHSSDRQDWPNASELVKLKTQPKPCLLHLQARWHLGAGQITTTILVKSKGKDASVLILESNCCGLCAPLGSSCSAFTTGTALSDSIIPSECFCSHLTEESS